MSDNYQNVTELTDNVVSDNYQNVNISSDNFVSDMNRIISSFANQDEM